MQSILPATGRAISHTAETQFVSVLRQGTSTLSPGAPAPIVVQSFSSVPPAPVPVSTVVIADDGTCFYGEPTQSRYIDKL